MQKAKLSWKDDVHQGGTLQEQLKRAQKCLTSFVGITPLRNQKSRKVACGDWTPIDELIAARHVKLETGAPFISGSAIPPLLGYDMMASVLRFRICQLTEIINDITNERELCLSRLLLLMNDPADTPPLQTSHNNLSPLVEETSSMAPSMTFHLKTSGDDQAEEEGLSDIEDFDFVMEPTQILSPSTPPCPPTHEWAHSRAQKDSSRLTSVKPSAQTQTIISIEPDVQLTQPMPHKECKQIPYQSVSPHGASSILQSDPLDSDAQEERDWAVPASQEQVVLNASAIVQEKRLCGDPFAALRIAREQKACMTTTTLSQANPHPVHLPGLKVQDSVLQDRVTPPSQKRVPVKDNLLMTGVEQWASPENDVFVSALPAVSPVAPCGPSDPDRKSLLTRLGFRQRFLPPSSSSEISVVKPTAKAKKSKQKKTQSQCAPTTSVPQLDEVSLSQFAYNPSPSTNLKDNLKPVENVANVQNIRIGLPQGLEAQFEKIDWMQSKDNDVIRAMAEHFGINAAKSVSIQYVKKELSEIQRYLTHSGL